MSTANLVVMKYPQQINFTSSRRARASPLERILGDKISIIITKEYNRIIIKRYICQ